MAKKDRVVKVLGNEPVGAGIYELTLLLDDMPSIKGGQFVHLELKDKTHILRRPFCIADYNVEKSTITVYYAVVGEGTKTLCEVKAGDTLHALLPLGNGFEMKSEYKRVMLIGGGMGTAVMPAIPTTWSDREYYTFLGFGTRDKMIAYDDLASKSKEIYVTTDDGTFERKGFITEAIRENIDRIDPDVIMICGPEILYKVLRGVLGKYTERTYISLEKRMGCGIGACLVCNCKVKMADGTNVYKRACVDGPVFRMDEVVLDE